MNQDPYATLGVERNASEEEVAKAFRRLAKIHHPDLNQGNPEAARKMSEINKAYAEIKSGRAGREDGPSARSGAGGYGPYGGYGSSPGSADEDPGPAGYGFDPFDLFGFSGRAPGGEEAQGPSWGPGGQRETGTQGPVSILSGFVRVLVGLSVANLLFMFFGRFFL
jgi:DnaJ-class molecular chaperone